MAWQPGPESGYRAQSVVNNSGVEWTLSGRQDGRVLHLGCPDGAALTTAGARKLGLALVELADRLDKEKA